MNCESMPMLLSAALDGELSPGEQAPLRQHLEQCPSCREQWAEWQLLHRDLAMVFPPPEVNRAIDRTLERIIVGLPVAAATPIRVEASRRPPRRRTTGPQLAVFLVVCSLLVLAAFILQQPIVRPAVAEISLVTGPVEYKTRDDKDWVAMSASSRVALPALARIRTNATSLCEIRTKSDAIVRLNKESELVVHQAEKVELVAGELWCRAPATAGVEICSAQRKVPSRQLQSFTCPSSTEMQWRALPDMEVSCVSGTSARIKLPEMTCTIEPGESLSISSQNSDAAPRRMDMLLATNWQLPLLLLRSPDDLELQERLTRLLGVVGQTKASYFYAEEIRELGPAGAIPLLAFVRSRQSLANPALRWRAMDFAAEQAGDSSIRDLESLLSDSDPNIQRAAQRALQRLQPDRKFPEL